MSRDIFRKLHKDLAQTDAAELTKTIEARPFTGLVSLSCSLVKIIPFVVPLFLISNKPAIGTIVYDNIQYEAFWLVRYGHSFWAHELLASRIMGSRNGFSLMTILIVLSSMARLTCVLELVSGQHWNRCGFKLGRQTCGCSTNTIRSHVRNVLTQR
jgi:hypothetical protein